jgi:hypothetical protein
MPREGPEINWRFSEDGVGGVGEGLGDSGRRTEYVGWRGGGCCGIRGNQ